MTFIERYIDEIGCAPTFDEMKAHLGLASKSNLHRLLECLEKDGLIKREYNAVRGIHVVKPSENKFPIPIHLASQLRDYASQHHTTPAAVLAEAVTAYLGLEQ